MSISALKPGQKIAIIGSGISGLTTAYLLSRKYQVTMYEANDYIGGHTHTHEIELADQNYRIDSGFIVFNPTNYPLFSQLLKQLKVDSQPTQMSFSVRNIDSGLEYNGHTIKSLFCQKRNIINLSFWKMIVDLLRFYRDAPNLLDQTNNTISTGDYLKQNNYSNTFIQDHLLPMASALWSAPSEQVLQFPMAYMIRFFQNHHMLQIRHRPLWQVIKNGSSSYIPALTRGFADQIRLQSPVRLVKRGANITIHTQDGQQDYFDAVVFACHSDQALSILEKPSQKEQQVLGAIDYQKNEAVLHTDTRLLPKNPTAWASWNATVSDQATKQCCVSYNMNILQGINASKQFLVTLNQTDQIDPACILKKMQYAHPVYTQASVAAQQRRHEIQGQQSSWFCGAYWGWGFHEDGVRSAVELANELGVNFHA